VSSRKIQVVESTRVKLNSTGHRVSTRTASKRLRVSTRNRARKQAIGRTQHECGSAEKIDVAVISRRGGSVAAVVGCRCCNLFEHSFEKSSSFAGVVHCAYGQGVGRVRMGRLFSFEKVASRLRRDTSRDSWASILRAVEDGNGTSAWREIRTSHARLGAGRMRNILGHECHTSVDSGRPREHAQIGAFDTARTGGRRNCG
jgi:hypothetical protein